MEYKTTSKFSYDGTMNHQLTCFRVEKLSIPLFTSFLDVVEELRGEFLRKVSDAVSSHIRDILYRKDLSWKYVFEGMDEEALKREKLDSPGFIRFCDLE